MCDQNQLKNSTQSPYGDKLCGICGESLELDAEQIEYLVGADVYHFDCIVDKEAKKEKRQEND